MSTGVARRERLFPLWLGGPLVSELAYRIWLFAFPHGVPRRAGWATIEPAADGVYVVGRLSELLEEDEADVLRALAELERVGVLTKKGVRP